MLSYLLIALLIGAPEPVNTATFLLAAHNPRSSDDSHRQIQCILQQLQLPYQLLAMPWRRAKQEVKYHRIDGYYTAMPSSELNEVAILSTPLFLENWYWFWRAAPNSTSGIDKLRYGVILGSHQADWLRQQGIEPELEVNETSQLIQLLHIGRIDSFVADLDDFNQTRQRLKLDAEQFEQRFIRYVALGAYFSKQRLQQRPGFLNRFNEAASLCAARPFALSASEQQKIIDIMLEHVVALAQTPQLIQAVQQQNNLAMSVATLQKIDTEWQHNIGNGQTELTHQLMQSPAALVLQSWQANYSHLITEVILMDSQGANVAISQLTSDYWQGDETQFLGVFNQPLPYFVDIVEYDQSTSRFQVKLSVPVTNGGGRHLGVLSIGIDVEHALSESD